MSLKQVAEAMLNGDQDADYCMAMSARRLCLHAGEEELAAKLYNLAATMKPSTAEMIAAGYGV